MAKLTLNTVQNGYSATTDINANSALIEEAFENTLSRDGSSPNTMQASLDMNSHRILNLPDAVNNQEPVTLAQAGEILGMVDVATQAQIGLLLYPRTGAESSAIITPTYYNYDELNVLRYGADPTGATSSTTAFNSARAVQVAKGGGEIIVPAGLYKVNLVIIGDNFKYRAEDDYYENPGTSVGLIADTATNPVIQIGDGTTSTRNGRFYGISIRGVSSAEKGVRCYGCSRVRFDNFSIRGFLTYQIQLDSSATRSTSYVYFNGMDLATNTTTGSIGLDYNYGASSVTAIYVSNSNLSAASGGGRAVELEDDCQLRCINTWMSLRTLQGVYFGGTNSRLIGSNLTLDSSSSSDILVEFNFDDMACDELQGDIAIDGVIRMTSGDTPAQSGRFWLPRNSLIRDVHIQQKMHFEDTSVAAHLQHTMADTAQNIYRYGTALRLVSSDGNAELRGGTAGEVKLMEDASTSTALKLRFGTSGALIWSGSGSPEGVVTAPKGSEYLRNDGGANTIVYIKQSGSGNTGWVAQVSARAWGTLITTTSPSVTAGHNIASISRTAVGQFQITFTNAMADANYSVVGTTSYDGAGICVVVPSTRTTTTFDFSIVRVTGTPGDTDTGSPTFIQIFGN